MAAPALASPALTTCPKCEGSGKFQTFSAYTGRCSYSGVCFNCDGSGEVLLSSVDGSEAARLLTGNILYTVQYIINPAAADGDTERVEFYMTRMVKRMFMIGKPNARRILDALSEGRWYDNQDRSGFIGDASICSQLRARCIELGREAKAA